MAIQGVGYVNLFVSDLDKALGFYRDALGLKVLFAEKGHGYASLQAGPITIGLALPGDTPDLVGRHTGIGLVVDDLEAEHARLEALGVSFQMPPSRQPWGGFMALVQDPDGNLLYLDEVSAAHA